MLEGGPRKQEEMSDWGSDAGEGGEERRQGTLGKLGGAGQLCRACRADGNQSVFRAECVKEAVCSDLFWKCSIPAMWQVTQKRELSQRSVRQLSLCSRGGDDEGLGRMAGRGAGSRMERTKQLRSSSNGSR